MKYLVLVVVMGMFVNSAFAAEKAKKVMHDKEHHHVGSPDHEHDEGHHKDHDHKAHHKDHDDSKKVGEDEHEEKKK